MHQLRYIIEKKENKIASKPWITRDKKTSMKTRDKFYKHYQSKKNYQNIIHTKNIGLK